jgi:hypothetical protein
MTPLQQRGRQINAVRRTSWSNEIIGEDDDDSDDDDVLAFHIGKVALGVGNQLEDPAVGFGDETVRRRLSKLGDALGMIRDRTEKTGNDSPSSRVTWSSPVEPSMAEFSIGYDQSSSSDERTLVGESPRPAPRIKSRVGGGGRKRNSPDSKRSTGDNRYSRSKMMVVEKAARTRTRRMGTT